ncbi:hypothetical protein W97_09259 [Coniosporium apollinis CBS 100218]|uniref:Uncharacterized protein n=1 Tax=Coniosporium apollinis (strain CBS 100218) TaxID=1168221 RepID=R7Z7A7_CONA1|nr:uncharacterized protein W97_09259 [Coniosporium apollinis CBS 100218]EON69993.1 hypothetical protein W97_09259 [Coniosporium apollinis CBS 100218]
MTNGVTEDNLPTKLVRQSIQKAFEYHDLPELITERNWSSDESRLDIALVHLFVRATDIDALGPIAERFRQLYDLVKSFAASLATKTDHPHAEDRETKLDDATREFFLKSLVLSSLKPPERPTGGSNVSVRDLIVPAIPTVEAATQLVATLSEALGVLSSGGVYGYFDWKEDTPGWKYTLANPPLIKPEWRTELLSEDGAKAVDGVFGANTWIPLPNLHQGLLNALRRATNQLEKAITAEEKTNDTVSASKGVFPLGHLGIVNVSPTWLQLGAFKEGDSVSGTKLPTPLAPLVSPTGVGDLIVVRDHIVRYEKAEIGNIQNVLQSEHFVRETKRLDRTELTTVTTSSTETEEQRDSQMTERFALNRVASNVIKEDSANKAGISISAKYGPTVDVKSNASWAENKSRESATKIASQYSKDVTSRASSKVIVKTFKSTTSTTIAQFEENVKHEFENNKTGSKNIAGIYQWVNKVTPYTLYPYYWARRSTWAARATFSSADPVFADFVKAGAAKVHFAAKPGFGKDVLYFMETGRLWQAGPVSRVSFHQYASLAKEVEEAEKNVGTEKVQGEPWETVVPTSLVRLRMNSKLPIWENTGKNGWKESAATSDDAQS